MPLAIFLYPGRFSVTPGGYFHPWLLLALAPLLWPRRSPSALKWLWLYCLAQIYLWGLQLRELRYLLIILPWLAVSAAWGAARLLAWTRGRRWPKAALTVGLLLPALLTAALHLFGLFMYDASAWEYLTGQVSAHEHLLAASHSYRVMTFMDETLPPQARVLFLFAGQHYYCPRECTPDPIYDRWSDWLARAGAVDALAAHLCAAGYTHIYALEGQWVYARPGPREYGLLSADEIAAYAEFRARYLAPLPGLELTGHAVYSLRCPP